MQTECSGKLKLAEDVNVHLVKNILRSDMQTGWESLQLALFTDNKKKEVETCAGVSRLLR